MTAKYRAGIVGAGQIGRAHAVGYQLTDAVELVAVTEPNQRVRAEFQQQHKVPMGYADMQTMMEAEKLDFVSVCTWHLLHEPQTLLAAGYEPKAVICEKPMTVGMASVQRMIEGCQKRGVKLVIGHQRRYYHAWSRARQLIGEGAIGQPQMVTAKSGEGLLNCGTHVIDACRYLLGDPVTEWVMGAVERNTDRYEREVRIEDCCMALIQFEGGAQALVQSDLTPEEWSVEAYQVRGTDGVLELAGRTIRYVNGSAEGWVEIEPEYEDPWGLQAQDAVRWVEGGPEPRGSGHQAARTVEIMMALCQSARNHEVVRMPLEEENYPLDLMYAEGKLPVRQEGAYDIRSFLAMEPAARERYNQLRQEGMDHRTIAATMRNK